jgi:hypothetical protein
MIVATTDMAIATTEMIEATAAIGQGLLRVEVITKIVVPGLRPPGGRLMIEGLQGTMITGEGVMMIAERLIIIMTDAGTI